MRFLLWPNRFLKGVLFNFQSLESFPRYIFVIDFQFLFDQRTFFICCHSFFKNVYLFWGGGERERVSREGAEREGKKESEAGSTLPVQRPNEGLEPTNREIVTWAEIKGGMLNQLSHPGAPLVILLKLIGTHFNGKHILSLGECTMCT